MKRCSADGCRKARSARGWCRMHYTRFLRHGDPMLTKHVTERGTRRGYAKGGLSTISLAKFFGVSTSNVRLIVHRKSWEHVQ